MAETPPDRRRGTAGVTAALSLQAVGRAFGGLQAVRDVSFDVEPGARMAVIGPNGAGKTTLFNLITGETLPTSGRIRIFGRDVTRLPPNRRAALGLGRTYQVTNLLPRLTVLDNMLLASAGLERTKFSVLRPMRAFRHLHARAETLLSPLGLWEVRDATVSELSYGDQRQLEIALALASSPQILLLDEPTAGLAAAETRALMEIVRSLPREITILLIEHDMSVVFGTCGRIMVLHSGEVVADGTPEAIRDDDRVREIYLGAGA
jgi:branched-chain amino acid transport system ATP-binding protein